MAEIDITDWKNILSSAGIEVAVDKNYTSRVPDGSFSSPFNITWVHTFPATQNSPGTDEWASVAWDSSEDSSPIFVDDKGVWHFIAKGPAINPWPGIGDKKTNITILFNDPSGPSSTARYPDAMLASLRRGTAAILSAKNDPANSLAENSSNLQIVEPGYGMNLDTERTGLDQLIKAGGLTAATADVAGGAAGTSAGTDAFKQGVFNYLFMGTAIDPLSVLYTGDLAPVNDQQLISTIQSIVSASLRSFMSGPDGSFIAFFPDYFGIYSGPNNYKLTLEDIELVDFKIDVNDDELATDVFVTGETLSTTGVVPITQAQWLQSNGVVNIRQQSAMALILGDQFADPANFDPNAFYAKFGLRPLKAQFQSVNAHIMEYLQALTLFQRKWSAQYRTQVQFTFMPELYPGMRVLVKSHNVTVFVEEVVHTGSFETGFQTTATISSPAAIDGGGIYGMVVGQI